MISVTEIILIAVGILAVILGYLIPGMGSDDFGSELTEQKINDMVGKAVRNAQGQIDDMLDESVEEAISKAERAMDRVTNEKMTAISEYSDTVMNDIHKNHDEVMFMYDMLNDKHKNLRNTVSEVDRAAREVKHTAEEAVITAEHAEAAARTAREAAMKAPVYSEPVYSEPVPEPEYFDESDINDEPVKGFYSDTAEDLSAAYNEESTPEAPKDDGGEFSSFAEIIENTPETELTESRILGYGQDSGEEEATVISESSAQEESYVQEDTAYESAPSEEATAAKVVSITDAARKKTELPEELPQATIAPMDDDPASRNQRILDMHKQGKSAVVIARELRLGIGEVKLVIDLAGKHKKNRSSVL